MNDMEDAPKRIWIPQSQVAALTDVSDGSIVKGPGPYYVLKKLADGLHAVLLMALGGIDRGVLTREQDEFINRALEAYETEPKPERIHKAVRCTCGGRPPYEHWLVYPVATAHGATAFTETEAAAMADPAQQNGQR